jgi:hypothetical protein
MVVTAGGLSLSGDRWIPAKNNFLVPVRALAKMVRGKFLDGLCEAFEQGALCFSGKITHWRNVAVFKRLVRKLRRTKWFVYAKPPFPGPRHVFNYLGHDTHRVAISNQRLRGFDGQTVTFRARNNEQPGSYRLVDLPAREFIRRFLLHVLPKGFIRIRHFGLMASRNVKTKLGQACRLLQASHPMAHGLPAEEHLINWQQLLLKLTGIDVTTCPNCGGTILGKPLPEIFPLSAFMTLSSPVFDTS